MTEGSLITHGEKNPEGMESCGKEIRIQEGGLQHQTALWLSWGSDPAGSYRSC